MNKVPNFVDMALTQEDREEYNSPSIMPEADAPIYPYGLCLSFSEKELAKLGITGDEANVGDIIHVHALGKVTSVSKRDTTHGTCCRIEVQLTAIAAEDESLENQEAENEMSRGSYKVDRSKFYR